jgi:ATP-dependent helicase/DNAse subunit B
MRLLRTFEPTPAQTSLLTALMKTCQDVHHFVPYLDDDKLFSRTRALGREGPIEVREPEGGLAAISKLFLSNERADLSSRVTMECYRDQLEEVRHVAQGVQRLLSSGVPHERIAILLPMRRSLAPLMREVLADFEIEADLDTGMSLAESPVVQTVLDVLEVPRMDFSRERMVRMLSSPYLRFRSPGEEEAVSSNVIDRLSREASIVEGKENWSKRFGSLVHRLQEEAASPDVPDWRRHQFERKVQEVERASKNLEPLLERLSSLDVVRKVGDHVRAIRETLGHLEMDRHLHGADPTNSRREGAAFRQFLGVLDRMETSRLLCDQEVPFSQLVSMMRERASAMTVRTEGAPGRSITVAGLRSAALREFDHIFIPGLVEGDIPMLDLRHPFFDLGEAQRLGLLSNQDILRQERYYFIMALLSSKKGVHLSWSRSVEGDVVIPSSFVERIKYVWTTGSLSRSEPMASRLGGQMGLGYALARGSTPDPAWLQCSTVSPASLCDRIDVERRCRRGGYRSAHDAVLGEDAEVVSRMTRVHEDKVYSATMLEDYALCPFRYYMRNVLALEPIEDVSEDVQSRDLGSLFHETAFRFYRDRSARGQAKVSSENMHEALAEMRSIAEEECRNFSFSSPAWRSSRTRLIGEGRFPGWIGLFLQNEAADPLPGLMPSYFELWVGMRLNRERSDPSSVDRLAEVELGEGRPSRLRLRCKVDRVDLDGKGGFFVIDYKTGRNPPGPKDIEQGLALQIPLYILALENVMNKHGIGGAYYTIGSAEDTKVVPVMGDEAVRTMTRKRLETDLRGQLHRSARFAQTYIAGMMEARFHPSEGAGLCPNHCDFRHVCRFDEMRVLEMGGGHDADA